MKAVKINPLLVLIVVLNVIFGIYYHTKYNKGMKITSPGIADLLGVSNDNLWKVLGKTRIGLDDKGYSYIAHNPPEVTALDGTQIAIKGFMVPLESKEEFNHFILSKRTPTCPYCPPGEPNELIEVFTAKPVKWNDGLVSASGKFSLINNQNFGMFFKLDNAVVK